MIRVISHESLLDLTASVQHPCVNRGQRQLEVNLGFCQTLE